MGLWARRHATRALRRKDREPLGAVVADRNGAQILGGSGSVERQSRL